MTKANPSHIVEFEVTETRTDGPINENYTDRGVVAAQIARLNIDAVSEAVGDVIGRLASTLKPQEGGPSQCELEFAIKVSADGNIVISKIGGEVSLKVKVTWNRD